jgi:hypothetical protein
MSLEEIQTQLLEVTDYPSVGSNNLEDATVLGVHDEDGRSSSYDLYSLSLTLSRSHVPPSNKMRTNALNSK